MERSYNAALMREAMGEFADEVDCDEWVGKLANIMVVEGDNVGLAAYEYPGVYSVHWFYKVRGREALKLAERMLDFVFTHYGVETVRGMTETRLKAARWAARQVGYTSHGVVEKGGKEYELFTLTKGDFYNQKDHA